jgi:DNA-binding CsgD family transcriptional regulator
MVAQGEEHQIKNGLTQTMLKMWPALPFLGLGLWLAWSFLAFSGGAWLSDVEVNGENISKLFITSSISFATVALLAAFKSAWVATLLGKRLFVTGAGLVGALGSLLIIAAGPYYLGAYMGTASFPIFFIGGVLSGLSSGVLLLKCGAIYSALTPRRVLLYSSLAHILLACIYFIVLGVPSWHPVPGGPPISGIVALILVLPAAALVLSLADVTVRGTADAGDATAAERLDLEPEFARVVVRQLPAAFWKFLLMLLLFSTVVLMIRAVIVELHPVETTLSGSSLIMFLRILMALIFAVLSMGASGKRLNFGKIYSLIAVVLVVVIALLPTLGVLDVNWNLVVSAAMMFFEFVLWCLLVFIGYQRAISPVIVMGFGYGVYMLGNTAGWLLGSSGLPRIIDGPMVSIFYLVIAGIVLVLAFLLFAERDFDRLFSPADKSVVSLSELMEEDVAANSASQDSDEQSREPRKGRFMQQLDELATSRSLSPREAEVLRFLAMGRSSDFISEQLCISWNTARTHIHNVYVKLDVHTRQELMDLVDSLKMV